MALWLLGLCSSSLWEPVTLWESLRGPRSFSRVFRGNLLVILEVTVTVLASVLELGLRVRLLWWLFRGLLRGLFWRLPKKKGFGLESGLKLRLVWVLLVRRLWRPLKRGLSSRAREVGRSYPRLSEGYHKNEYKILDVSSPEGSLVTNRGLAGLSGLSGLYK